MRLILLMFVMMMAIAHDCAAREVRFSIPKNLVGKIVMSDLCRNIRASTGINLAADTSTATVHGSIMIEYYGNATLFIILMNEKAVAPTARDSINYAVSTRKNSLNLKKVVQDAVQSYLTSK